MFYDKKINILYDTSYMDDMGLQVEGEISIVKTVECDIQPISKKTAYIDYAFDKDCKYRVFCEPDGLLELGTQIQYKNNIYYIVEIIYWDDYYILLLDDKK